MAALADGVGLQVEDELGVGAVVKENPVLI